MKQDILIQLLSHKETFVDIIKKFPGMYSSCVSIKQNTSPDIVKKACDVVINFYNTNEKFKSFVDSYCIDKKSETSSVDSVAGLVIVIDKNEESYKKIMDTAKKERWIYKGVSIVEDFNNIRIYFY